MAPPRTRPVYMKRCISVVLLLKVESNDTLKEAEQRWRQAGIALFIFISALWCVQTSPIQGGIGSLPFTLIFKCTFSILQIFTVFNDQGTLLNLILAIVCTCFLLFLFLYRVHWYTEGTQFYSPVYCVLYMAWMTIYLEPCALKHLSKT